MLGFIIKLAHIFCVQKYILCFLDFGYLVLFFFFLLNKVTGATYINLKSPKTNTVNRGTMTPYTLSQKADLAPRT
jgi:hypothetical protein